jgi:1-deoxy-D-xylulose-5-phosphate reductoisomerase
VNPLRATAAVNDAARSTPHGVERRNVVLLGSTGSIGTNCLDVVRHFPDRFTLYALAAHSRIEELLPQVNEFRPRWVVLSDRKTFESFDRSLLPSGTELLFGEDGIARVVRDPRTDLVVSAIVGAAGLSGTWAALEEGKTVALANKETLVVAGELVMDLARRSGAELLPVDSEHSAVFQSLGTHRRCEVNKVVLTGSGGPFRGKTRAELKDVTPEAALKHPTWRMGPKISVDSATLMNKSLEVIEAHWLFDLAPEQIEVIIHPESIVHSFVEFQDGSVLAQLSPPDMKLPLQYAMLYPERLAGPARRMAWSELRQLRFEPPDRATFESVDLGHEVIRSKGTSGAILNAANEAAVARFLSGEVRFLDIGRICREVMGAHTHTTSPTLEELMAADRWARQEVLRWRSL